MGNGVVGNVLEGFRWGVGDEVAFGGPRGRYIYVGPICSCITSSGSVKLHLMQCGCRPLLMVSSKVLLSLIYRKGCLVATPA